MASILNIETSTEVCSVVLSKHGNILSERENIEGLNHSKLLSVFIKDILSESDMEINTIDAVAVSQGPGSYTGLRIGISLAKGICYSAGKPLIAIRTLDAMATYTIQNIKNYTCSKKINSGDMLFCPMIDARRMEVYTTLFDKKGNQLEKATAKIIDKNSFSNYLDHQPVLFFGNGASKCKGILTHPNAFFAGPVKNSARFMTTLAEKKYKKNEIEDVAYFEPLYLKDFIATIPKNKII